MVTWSMKQDVINKKKSDILRMGGKFEGLGGWMLYKIVCLWGTSYLLVHSFLL